MGGANVGGWQPAARYLDAVRLPLPSRWTKKETSMARIPSVIGYSYVRAVSLGSGQLNENYFSNLSPRPGF
jgi:hypothetical protein